MILYQEGADLCILRNVFARYLYFHQVNGGVDGLATGVFRVLVIRDRPDFAISRRFERETRVNDRGDFFVNGAFGGCVQRVVVPFQEGGYTRTALRMERGLLGVRFARRLGVVPLTIRVHLWLVLVAVI